MMYRLVLADIDGTLTTSDREITDRVRGAVREAQRRGVRVCLATGRAWQSGRRYFEGLGADPPAILYNGGMVYDFTGDRVLFRQTMDGEAALRVIEVLDAFPDLAAHMYVGDRIYVRWRTPLVEATALQDHLDPEPVGDLRTALAGFPGAFGGRAAAVDGQPMKFRILGPRDRLEALAEMVARQGVTNHVYSERESLEFLPAGVSKGAAMRFMVQHLQVSLAEVLAVGNDLNDLTMLEAAGLGVAMRDAPPELRRVAGYVAPTSDEDGLAEVIRRFVLEETR